MTSPGAAPPATGRGGVLARIRRCAAWIRWYVKELNGEYAYARYAERARTSGEPLLGRREFERARVNRRDGDPRESGRCC